ncbi:MAG: 7-cyano-7-deazaguanine reductase [Halioglobus sp.]|jgi:7-cyano-7-deazaguanine reductase
MDDSKGLLLGKHTPVVEVYSPELLYPIPREIARGTIGLSDSLPFAGVDLWHAYELSWLDGTGKPVVRVGRFSVPATTPNIVESKSFKLYLNSLNNHRFESPESAKRCMETDVSEAAGGAVTLELFGVGDAQLAGADLCGIALDELEISPQSTQPDASNLIVDPGAIKEEVLYTHLLRSLCPVTGQPDWATLWIHYKGAALDHSSLLSYIISYRQHQEYHEQCVERMFLDISSRIQPEFLHIQAFYTRRGGMDINPFRSTNSTAIPQPRLNRQ